MLRIDTRLVIAQALEELVSEGEFAKISVADITTRADVSRTTFYRYFRDKFEVVDWIYQTDFAKHVELRGLSLNRDSFLEWRQIGECVFEAILEHPDFYRNVTKYQGQNAFLASFVDSNVANVRKLVSMSPGLGTDAWELESSVRFYYAGVSGLVRQWLGGGCKESPHKLQAICEKCMPDLMRENYRILEEYCREGNSLS